MVAGLQRFAGLMFILSALTAPVLAAQEQRGRGPVVEEPAAPRQGDMQNAENTAQELQGLLQQYPPFVREVLRLDPSLLSNDQFLESYPSLRDFLAQHPEVLRSPAFFVGQVQFIDARFRSQNRSSATLEEFMTGLFIFTMFVTAATFLGFIIKMAIDHRRWLRIAKVQSEVHTKLLDRFSNNQDLLAYIQTPAGRHFLQSAPIVTEAGPRSLSAPVNRILWSVQAGVILALAGIGLNYVSGRVMEEIAGALSVIGVLAISLGIGFASSAVVAYFLSRRLGLLDRSPDPPATANPGGIPPDA